jgi:hypothetical protein
VGRRRVACPRAEGDRERVGAGGDVGLDAAAAAGAAAAEVVPVGGVVEADGQLQAAAIGEADELLEDALAERWLADDQCSAVVLSARR